MTNIPSTIATSLLLLVAANLSAQDVATDPDNQVVPVAEDSVEEVEDHAVPVPSDENLLANEFELFKQLMEDRVLDEADTVAKRIVELAIRIKGPQSNELARALTNLAIVQYKTEQHDAAQQNFTSAIEIIEENEDRLNAQLVNPLKGLGASQLEIGRPDLATSTFKRAVHVTHVNEGPHNLDQVELLESIAETYLRMGDLDMAKGAQESIYALNIRAYDLDSINLVPALMRRGAWQHRAGFIFDERTTYRRAIRIIEDKSDKNDLRLVEPLIMLGKSYFYLDTSGTQTFQETRLSTGEIYFKRAARIAAENAGSDWQVLAQAMLALGDYYVFVNNPQRGRQTFGDVWNLLSEDESRIYFRREQLEGNFPLKHRKLPEYVNSSNAPDSSQSDDFLLRGKVRMSYTITDRGRTKDVKLVEAEPSEFADMQRFVYREIRSRLFRPRFEDAAAVASPDQPFEHTFFYRQSDLDAITGGASTDETE